IHVSKVIAGSTTPATRQNDRWTFTGAVSPIPFSVPGTGYSPVTRTASARVIRVCGKANVAIAEQAWSKLRAVWACDGLAMNATGTKAKPIRASCRLLEDMSIPLCDNEGLRGRAGAPECLLEAENIFL